MNAKVSLTKLGLGNANGVLIYGLLSLFIFVNYSECAISFQNERVISGLFLF